MGEVEYRTRILAERKMVERFETFMNKEKKRGATIMLPYYVIAQYCLDVENISYNRSDILSIHSKLKPDDWRTKRNRDWENG